MKLLDFFFLAAVASCSAMCFYLGHTACSVFLGLFFFIALAAIVLHYLCSPLPRFVIGGFSIKPVEEDPEEPEEPEETEEKK